MNVIGNVTGRTCLLVDDIVDSGGTLVNAAEALLDHGATQVSGYITHGVLSGGAVARIMNSRIEGARHHRLDPAERGGAERQQYPHAAGRWLARRSDRAHCGREVRLEPVLLSALASERIHRREATARRPEISDLALVKARGGEQDAAVIRVEPDIRLAPFCLFHRA